MEQYDTGWLLDKRTIEMHRKWFKEMASMHGIKVQYKAPRKGKTYNLYGETDTNYCEPIDVWCIFDEHPTVWTQKKLGWNSELSDSLSIIHVPYDLPELQVGALFIIPGGTDIGERRVFKVIKMSTQFVYPASISCQVGPVIESDYEPSMINHEQDNFNLLADENDDEESNVLNGIGGFY